MDCKRPLIRLVIRAGAVGAKSSIGLSPVDCMCNQYSKTQKQLVLEVESFGSINFSSNPKYHIAPGQAAPIVVTVGGCLTARELRWGFASKGPQLFNAPVETAGSLKSLAEAWADGRCIVPADGFYKSRTIDGKQQPYRFVRASGDAFWFAGLWEGSRFLILTSPANGIVQSIDDRMPVILKESRIKDWLTDQEVGRNAASVIASAIPASTLDCYPVSAENHALGMDHPDAIAPLVIPDPELIPHLVDDPAMCWKQPAQEPPQGVPLQLLVTNEDVLVGAWTGEKFVANDREITPLRWRRNPLTGASRSFT